MATKAKTKPNPFQVQKFLKGVDYPVRKKDLVKHAKSNGAPSEIVSLLNSMEDHEFKRPTDVTKGVSAAR